MSLQRQSPLGVVEHCFHRGFEAFESLRRIIYIAGLEEVVLGLDVVVLAQVLTYVNHLQFIATSEYAGQ